MRHATLTTWEGDLQWEPGEAVSYADPHVPHAVETTYRTRSWHSPIIETSFPARELIPSWNACTPPGSWLLVEARVATDLEWTPWFTTGRWAETDPAVPGSAGAITRTTVGGQAFHTGRVAADVFLAASGHPFTRWQLRVTGLTRAAEPTDADWPRLTLLTAAASAFRIADDDPTSRPTSAAGVEIAVPPLSQRLHANTFPEWDEGGLSWCSPTSTTMLLAYWALAPTAEESGWVGHDTDPAVVHAVRQVFDRDYGGAGNWSFNAAYAGTRGLRAYITRLRDLTEAEAFVRRGIPLVVSVAFDASELDGAGYSTQGHLLAVIGFTDGGDVISNDPNSHQLASNEQVRVVYRRDQFERAWLRPRGGLTYVMHPPHVRPPSPPPVEPNWA